MSKEPADKCQILLKGGEYNEPNDTIENWLDFLTDPANLQPGLPALTVNCLSHHGTFVCSIYVKFSETKPSLKLLRLHLDYYDELLLPIFQETDPEQKAIKLTDITYAANNPHCLRDWIFGLFKQTELEDINVKFLNSELPDLFDQLPNLRCLTLYQSKIRRLPPSFYQLPALGYLNILDSLISEVPAELGQMQSLRNLEFSQPCSPKVLGSLRKLTTLNCKSHRFDVPLEITQLTDLKNLKLSSVNSAPDNFLAFPKLEYLYFHVTGNRTAFNFTQANIPRLKKLNTNHPAAFAPSIASFISLEYFTTGDGFDKPHGLLLLKSELDTLTNSLKQLSTLRRINLEDLGLADIEFCLSHPNLEYIYLSGNNIADLPAGLEKLPKLKRLDLSRNKIAHVPAELFNLFNNGVLDLKDNPFPGFPDSIKDEEKINILRHGGTHTIAHEKGETIFDWISFITDPINLQPGLPDLTVITEYVYFEDSTLMVTFDQNKASLRSLKFELNGIDEDNTDIFFDPNRTGSTNQSHLNKWIFNLFRHTELKELRITFLSTELPDLLGSLKKLKRIDFSRSKLIKLPQELFQLNDLEHLSIADTPITELPDFFDPLSKLRHIDLSGTKLTQLPASFVQLQNLEALYLNGTSITDLSNRLNALSNLKIISLYKSKLKELPPGFFLLPLEWLDLRYSSLLEIPVELGQAKTLRYLALSQSCLPSVWEDLTELTELHCDYHAFHVPEEFFALINLKKLHLNSVSSATNRPLTLPCLERLEFRVAKNSSPLSLHGNFPNLKLLETNCFQTFVSCLAGAKNLEKIVAFGKLEIAHHQLLKESFKYLSKLTHLELRGMGISNMEFCTSASNLEYLDLSKNEIADIPKSLSNLQKLQRLLLNKNPLVDFPELDVMPALISIQFGETKMPQDQKSPSDHPDSAILKRMASNFPNAILAYWKN